MTSKALTIHDAVQLMKQDGSRLAPPVPVDGMPPMTFVCSFSPDAVPRQEIQTLLPKCPSDLVDFWSEARTARLFVDQEYGQWGLEILAPDHAAAATKEYKATRNRDFVQGDLIIGKFLGDSDLLLLRCDPLGDDFGFVLIVLPLDRRADWYPVATSLQAFLNSYVKSGGEKFWTHKRN